MFTDVRVMWHERRKRHKARGYSLWAKSSLTGQWCYLREGLVPPRPVWRTRLRAWIKRVRNKDKKGE